MLERQLRDRACRRPAWARPTVPMSSAPGRVRVPIHTPRLELTAPPPTNTVCFRYRPAGWPDGEALDDLNRRIQAHVAVAGDVFCAQLANGLCQRAAIVSWRTRSDDVRALCEAVEEAGERLSTSSSPAEVADVSS
jgi:glutamate/tyrosine decarboxylase-like PLP-dependent enzyme